MDPRAHGDGSRRAIWHLCEAWGIAADTALGRNTLNSVGNSLNLPGPPKRVGQGRKLRAYKRFRGAAGVS